LPLAGATVSENESFGLVSSTNDDEYDEEEDDKAAQADRSLERGHSFKLAAQVPTYLQYCVVHLTLEIFLIVYWPQNLFWFLPPTLLRGQPTAEDRNRWPTKNNTQMILEGKAICRRYKVTHQNRI
jgi:hypothetical protein